MSELYYPLRERYSPKPAPKCPVCGEEMSMQRISGSHVVYACSGMEDDGCFKTGRTYADEHYKNSRISVVDGSDPDVIELLDENVEMALTLEKLRVELEGKDSKIANLTAERDALREGERGDARHSNTRDAADIYFQLVEECEIPAGGSLVEYVDDMREKLEAAEKRIAELESDSQAQKLVEAIIVAIENEQERLFDEDYLMDSKECIDVIREEVKRWNDSRTAGIRIKGE
ncbi:TPA: ead/Ea22-like family protein [Escherichia coli]